MNLGDLAARLPRAPYRVNSVITSNAPLPSITASSGAFVAAIEDVLSVYMSISGIVSVARFE
jgi:hypothetical protein